VIASWARGIVAVTVVGIVGLILSGRAVAGSGPTPAEYCQATKNEAAGAEAACLAEGHAAAARGKTFNFAKCETNFAKAFSAAEQKVRPEMCPTEADTAAIETIVNTCIADIASALAGNQKSPPCFQEQLQATGQTTCWNGEGTGIPCPGTGQDGDFRAGRALSYTDNGDGTITDNVTALMWEKKSADGSIHDKDKTYSWDEAFAVHIATLNTPPCFAGHCDWRLPNIRELLSIVDYKSRFPAVPSAFNTGCVAACTVLTCSCTADRNVASGLPGVAAQWSSSTFVTDGTAAWLVDFQSGFPAASNKVPVPRVIVPGVRAVRGAL